jgi:hypothetical protein
MRGQGGITPHWTHHMTEILTMSELEQYDSRLPLPRENGDANETRKSFIEDVIANLASTLRTQKTEAGENSGDRLTSEDNKRVEEFSKEIVGSIKNGTFGDFRSRDRIESIMSYGLGAGRAEFLQKVADQVNKDLKDSGSDLRLDMLMLNSGKCRNPYDNWNDRFKDAHFVLTPKDAPKYSLLGEKEYFAAAKDKVSMKFQEMKDLPKEAQEIYSLVDKIKNLDGKLPSTPEGQKHFWGRVQSIFESANEYLHPNVVKELVDEVNQRLAKEGSKMRLTYNESSEQTSKPGFGRSGLGRRDMSVGLVDGSGKKQEGFMIEQLFTWGAPILPGPPERDWDDRFIPGIRPKK